MDEEDILGFEVGQQLHDALGVSVGAEAHAKYLQVDGDVLSIDLYNFLSS